MINFNDLLKALTTALNGTHGPLYIGIAAISALVFGAEIMDHHYGVEAGGINLKPQGMDGLAEVYDKPKIKEAAPAAPTPESNTKV